MNVSALALRSKSLRRARAVRPLRAKQVGSVGGVVPPLSPRLQLVRSALIMVLVLAVCLLAHLFVLSSLQQRSTQRQNYDSFRAELARGTAPIGPTDADGAPLALGTPVAYLEIRAIGMELVVTEGSNGTVLFDGPGHRRDTPLPGQVGTSVVVGRNTSYGGPFGRLEELIADDKITVTTGQGVFDFRVIGVRREGDPVPPAPAGGTARLTLVTAAGSNLLPSGLLRVDAELTGTAVGGPARLIAASALPDEERAMAGQTDTLWALALWLQALVMLSVALVWGWLRWGRLQAWIVFVPPLALVGLSASGELAKLLPNLL